MRYSFAAVEAHCEALMQSESDIFLVITVWEEGQFVATLDTAPLAYATRAADVRILIGEKSYWGKGIATDAMAALCVYLFDRLGMRKLTAGLMAVNPRMLRVFERLSFQREGMHRKQDRRR